MRDFLPHLHSYILFLRTTRALASRSTAPEGSNQREHGFFPFQRDYSGRGLLTYTTEAVLLDKGGRRKSLRPLVYPLPAWTAKVTR
jgi:hypothetical protein